MKLLLISDDPMFMDQVETELTKALAYLRIIGKCYSLKDGMRALQALSPDIVLLDGDIKGGVRDSSFFENLSAKHTKLLILASNIGGWSKHKDAATFILPMPFDPLVIAHVISNM
jgi:response regulator of citrate/malate metabolism